MATAFADLKDVHYLWMGVLLDLRTLMRRRKHKKRTRAEQTRMIAPIACPAGKKRCEALKNRCNR
jgi:hypothetical protein